MVYLGKHTMPVFLFKGWLEEISGNKIQFDVFFTDILPQLRSEFIFRARIANLASNMIRLKLWTLETYYN